MFKTIEGAADCEIRSVIRFLNARNVLPSEIHHQICQVYGDSAMSDGMVRKWVRMFSDGRENVHNEARSGHRISSKMPFNIHFYSLKITFLCKWCPSYVLANVN